MLHVRSHPQTADNTLVVGLVKSRISGIHENRDFRGREHTGSEGFKAMLVYLEGSYL
jgi:hypothetical protein